MRHVVLLTTIGLLLFFYSPLTIEAHQSILGKEIHQLEKHSMLNVERFSNDDAVRGIYVSSHSAGSSRFHSLLSLVDESDLNAMVIDIKDDYGNVTYDPGHSTTYKDIATNYIQDLDAVMKELNDHNVYPIARIVVFKDSLLANKKPELSFLNESGDVWLNGRGEAFVNPFLEEVWHHNIMIAKEAAKAGFKEIQFDYVRFPEGFETRDRELEYSIGNYDRFDRVQAVTDFVSFAKEELETFDVDVSVDLFGYATVEQESAGIGQNFSRIAESVDVISSMIYPSHWSGNFGIEAPDTMPYELISAYAKVENQRISELSSPPITRPWIQDFTASWLGEGKYIPYGPKEVEAQIQALHDHGIDEYLIWNAGNTYSEGTNYAPKRTYSTK
ncbi:putative glycoside hydrolase [Geomicrobium sp. JCM 19055]|uniref:putative glycoside hydrolase n=1 Tax=Geomicrobium sp. JCM 19055 TaxID=1460649 RepID=UPI00045EDC92|nr:putative glycoside hydrolase [Geomicrobium sp. JCM 19055]GAK00966.1 predicted glycoside hydrolase [Geomicrobium sp. JCM 19055]